MAARPYAPTPPPRPPPAAAAAARRPRRGGAAPGERRGPGRRALGRRSPAEGLWRDRYGRGGAAGGVWGVSACGLWRPPPIHVSTPLPPRPSSTSGGRNARDGRKCARHRPGAPQGALGRRPRGGAAAPQDWRARRLLRDACPKPRPVPASRALGRVRDQVGGATVPARRAGLPRRTACSTQGLGPTFERLGFGVQSRARCLSPRSPPLLCPQEDLGDRAMPRCECAGEGGPGASSFRHVGTRPHGKERVNKVRKSNSGAKMYWTAASRRRPHRRRQRVRPLTAAHLSCPPPRCFNLFCSRQPTLRSTGPHGGREARAPPVDKGPPSQGGSCDCAANAACARGPARYHPSDISRRPRRPAAPAFTPVGGDIASSPRAPLAARFPLPFVSPPPAIGATQPTQHVPSAGRGVGRLLACWPSPSPPNA
jgi:hypothetical protein